MREMAAQQAPQCMEQCCHLTEGPTRQELEAARRQPDKPPPTPTTHACGLTPLLVAAAFGRTAQILEFARRHGRDKFIEEARAISGGHDNIVHVATRCGQLAVIKLLVDEKLIPESFLTETTKQMWTPVSIACTAGNEEIIRFFMSHGVSLTDPLKSGSGDSIFAAENSGQLSECRPLTIAIGRGCEFLLDDDKVAAGLCSVLCAAEVYFLFTQLYQAKPALLLRLITKHGLPVAKAYDLWRTEPRCVHLITLVLGSKEERNALDLMNAVEESIGRKYSHTELAEVNAARAASSPSARERFPDHTPLHTACVSGHVEAVRILLEQREGAHLSVNDRAKNFDVPLASVAACVVPERIPQIVDLLLKHGADPNKVRYRGQHDFFSLLLRNDTADFTACASALRTRRQARVFLNNKTNEQQEKRSSKDGTKKKEEGEEEDELRGDALEIAVTQLILSKALPAFVRFNLICSLLRRGYLDPNSKNVAGVAPLVREGISFPTQLALMDFGSDVNFRVRFGTDTLAHVAMSTHKLPLIRHLAFLGLIRNTGVFESSLADRAMFSSADAIMDMKELEGNTPQQRSNLQHMFEPNKAVCTINRQNVVVSNMQCFKREATYLDRWLSSIAVPSVSSVFELAGFLRFVQDQLATELVAYVYRAGGLRNPNRWIRKN